MRLPKPFTIINKFYRTAWDTVSELLSGAPNPVASWGFRLRFCVTFIRQFLKHHPGSSLQDARDLIQLKPDFTLLPYYKITMTIPDIFRRKAHEIIRARLERDLGCYPADESTLWSNSGPLRAEWITPNTTYPCDHHTLLYFHGGGFILGSVHSHRAVLRKLTKGANCQVLAVNYRLAPEYPFPCGLEDCLATYLYLTDQDEGEKFPGCCINPNQVIVGGDSAGGNLAAALVITLRDHPDLRIPRGVMLWSPWVDLKNGQTSFYSNVPTDMLPLGKSTESEDSVRSTLLGEDSDWQEESDFVKLILFGSCSELQERFKKHKHFYTDHTYLTYPLVSPLYDHRGFEKFPPTFIQVGDREMLRDEGIYMAELLTRVHINTAPSPTAVQPVSIQIYQDMPHAFQIMQFNRLAKLAIHRSCSFLRQCFVSDTPQFFHTKMYHPIDGTQPKFIKSKKLAIHQHHSFDGVDRFIYWASIDGVICKYKHGYFLKVITKWSLEIEESRIETQLHDSEHDVTLEVDEKATPADEPNSRSNSSQVTLWHSQEHGQGTKEPNTRDIEKLSRDVIPTETISNPLS